MMKIGIISLFPGMFSAITEYGIIGRAVKNGLLNIKLWNPRDYTSDRYRTVDNRPYGGSPGMLMMIQPIKDAIQAAKSNVGIDAKVIYLSPQGRKLNQQGVFELTTQKKLILVCGRYKGIDQRIINSEINEEWSIGDYILSGGELPAMVLIDSISRLIPMVLNHTNLSVKEDSFTTGLLDCPHYTRPKVFDNMKVPSVLLSGNHAKIKRWKIKQSIGFTWLKRPELLNNLKMNDEQKVLLEEFKQEYEDMKIKKN